MTVLMHQIQILTTDTNQCDVSDNKNPAAKKVTGGVLSTKMEALCILRQFQNSNRSLTPPPIDKTTEQDAADDSGFILEDEMGGLYNNDELFHYSKEDMVEDLSYYCSSTSGKKRCTLTSGGPPKPDTLDMTDAESRMVMKEWGVAQTA